MQKSLQSFYLFSLQPSSVSLSSAFSSSEAASSLLLEAACRLSSF